MIRVSGLTVRQGGFRLRGIDLEVPAGAYAVLMGRTGSGKTTLLEAICGLRPAHAGRVELCGRDVTGAAPRDRAVGYVPQDVALFPTLSVARNIGFALEVRGDREGDIRRRVAELAEWLGVAHLLGRRPPGLSGGEKQRVALGRALAARPPVLLLDEPLGALDEATRAGVLELLSGVRKDAGVTALHVTHSRVEADALADIRLSLRGGRVEADHG